METKPMTRQQRRNQQRQLDKQTRNALKRTYGGQEMQEVVERTMAQAFVMMQALNKDAIAMACAETKGIGAEREATLQREFAIAFDKVVTKKLDEVNAQTRAKL